MDTNYDFCMLGPCPHDPVALSVPEQERDPKGF